jgi:hypothetical protein
MNDAHVTKYDRMPLPPVEAHTTWFEDGALAIGVEYREVDEAMAAAAQHQAAVGTKGSGAAGAAELADRGVSLHVCGVERGARSEYLRFDCFAEDPHYHYVSWRDRTNHMLHLDPVAEGDPLAWALERIRHRLKEMLARAGAGELAARIESGAVERLLPRVSEAAFRARSLSGREA